MIHPREGAPSFGILGATLGGMGADPHSCVVYGVTDQYEWYM